MDPHARARGAHTASGGTDVIADLPHIRDLAGGTLFVIHGDMGAIDADFYLLPTDTSGTVEPSWQRLWNLKDRLSTPWPSEMPQLIQAADGMLLLPCDVGGATVENSVEGMVSRLRCALTHLRTWIANPDPSVVEVEEGASERPRAPRRARPLLAMPLIGTKAGGLGQERGYVIQALIDTLYDFLDEHADSANSYDIALVCRSTSDYAAVQHVRRERAALSPQPEWLKRLVEYARGGALAVLFGAGASAAAGLPLWNDLLLQLAERFEVPEQTAKGLLDLDPTDAATLLAEHAARLYGDRGQEVFLEELRVLVGLEQPTLTHALLANLRPAIAITTNYDQGYEIAAQSMGLGEPDVLPWRRHALGAAPLVLKLHGDVERGLIVLSRDDFVAMHAYRRPLAGVLQNHMLAGHVLIVGSSMSDATLVHAAEEVAGLLRQVDTGTASVEAAAQPNGTILMGNPHPARQEILSRSLTVVTASDRRVDSSEAARRIDIVLDLINCLASKDRSFLLDERYIDLLPLDEHELVAELVSLSRRLGREQGATDLQQLVYGFLKELGAK